LHHEIRRPPVERHVELRIGHARAVDDRLVVASEQPARFAELGDPHRAKILLEESARLVALERPRHPLADVLESAGERPGIAELALPVEHLAARLERRKGSTMIVAGPASKVGPLDWLKLAVRDLQRIDGGLAARLIERHHVKHHGADEPHPGCCNPCDCSKPPNRNTSNR
jgi:hypothetical protein